MNIFRTISNNQDHFWMVQNDLEEISQTHDFNDTYFSNISVSVFETLEYLFSEENMIDEVQVNYLSSEYKFSVRIQPVKGEMKLNERLTEVLSLVCDEFQLDKDLQVLNLDFNISGMMHSKSNDRIRQFINYSNSGQGVLRNILTNGKN